MQFRRLRDSAASRRDPIEELKSVEARTVEIVVDVVSEVVANGIDGEAEARTPFVGEMLDVLGKNAMVARVDEDVGHVELGRGFGEGGAADCPYGEYERLAGLLKPEFGEIVDVVAGCGGEQGGVSD